MKLCRISLFIASVIVFSGCDMGKDGDSELSLFTNDYNFDAGLQEWVAGFADYPANPKDSSAFELKFAYRSPIESKLSKASVMLSGNNANQDLFMYIKRKVDGLQPNTDYILTFNVELASDLQEVLTASGGSVFLKAGATHSEPKSVIEDGNYVMNIDKGNQGAAGEDMITLGDLFVDGTGTAYSLVTRSNNMSNTRYVAKTNSNGELWLIVGTDSSIAGTTKIFYTRIRVLFSAS